MYIVAAVCTQFWLPRLPPEHSHPFFACLLVLWWRCWLCLAMDGVSTKKELDRRNSGDAPRLGLELVYGPLGLAAPAIEAGPERVLGVRQRPVRV